MSDSKKPLGMGTKAREEALGQGGWGWGWGAGSSVTGHCRSPRAVASAGTWQAPGSCSLLE